MKKILPFILIVLLGVPMFAADYLYVRQGGGDTQLAVSNIKEITFPSGAVVVTMTDGTSKTYSSSTFVSLRFNGNVNVGIEDVLNESQVTFNGQVVKSAQPGIAVFSADGRLVLATEEAQADVSSLASGIYVVKTGCVTTKIVK